jgi:ATP-dependent helicase HrpA
MSGEPELEITYPSQLPVSQRRKDIARAIGDNQVVIVAGETGSGKTTQLPKICLELGRGTARGGTGGLIGHTQPRRIAARAVATRIAEELGSELGDLVGYQVRFTDKTSAQSRVKLMTDGILLAELQRDRQLRKYDTIIIDEAHERSLNIDFLLGYLKQLLPQRPDLKVIITSATIDPERFAEHFADATGRPAPIIEVSGRTFPVEIRYRPLVADTESDEEGEPVVRDQTEAIVDAVRELLDSSASGDTLVFLPGEREIRDTADALSATTAQLSRPGRQLEIVPLYSRLAAAEQQRVFSSHPASVRRVVLATNVAETSLTVPGITSVIDTGLARISRYSSRTKVQRLPIEAISQASAQQRSGRCGRVAAGVAIRLYAEEDFAARPEFTTPEILRTNLASVILQMASLGLAERGLSQVVDFGFIDPPDKRAVAAGVQLLEELGAVTARGRLTKLGRRLARLPIDPRLGRMIIEAERLGCTREVLVIAAALSLQDPRERPAEERPRADQFHARFTDHRSDFMTWLNLWRHLSEQQAELSSSAFRRMCKREYLNYLRVREWQDFESQLRQVAREMGIRLGERAPTGRVLAGGDEDAIHQSLLAGLLSQIGSLDERESVRPGERRPIREYAGARGARFAIFPGSGLRGKNPQFLMAAELVETSRLWARQAAAIEPEWAERLGAHLVKRTYSEPHWSAKRTAVMAYERVTLYGVTLVADRPINYARIDPRQAREIFIRHALVYGEWSPDERGRHAFFAKNRQLLEAAAELEHRARRRDIVVDEHTLFDFYDARIGPDVVSGAHFDTWWKAARREDPELLTFDPAMLTRDTAEEIREADFPVRWSSDESLNFAVSYHFEPGAPDDGVTIDLPVVTLNRVEAEEFSWNVPGLREELVTALIRSLPKNLRVHFVPAPNTARQFLAAVPPGDEPLLDALQRYLLGATGVLVPREAWGWEKIPEHLRPTFRVVDDQGREAARGKDLAALKAPLQPQFEAALNQVMGELTDPRDSATGRRTWAFGTIEPSFLAVRAGHQVVAYPALVDEGDAVSLRGFGTEAEALAHHRTGVARLLALGVADPRADILGNLDNVEKLALAGSPYASVGDLLADCRIAALLDLVDAAPPIRTEAEYAGLLTRAATEHPQRVREVVAAASAALTAWRAADRLLSGRADLPLLPALSDLRNQVAGLVHPGFVAAAGLAQLRHYPRYFAALTHRRARLEEQINPDRALMDRFAEVNSLYQGKVSALPEGAAPPEALRRTRWLLEEYRVSLWAQHLGTSGSVSDQRIRKALA